MAQLNKNLNLAGRVITESLTDVTLKDANGIIFRMLYLSGNLSIKIRNKKGSCGCSPEILSLILHLSKDGNISGKWVLS